LQKTRDNIPSVLEPTCSNIVQDQSTKRVNVRENLQSSQCSLLTFRKTVEAKQSKGLSIPGGAAHWV
jgi:hypothetical protein